MGTEFQGAIFDVDGVLVDSPHEPAWRDTLRELMDSEWADIRPQTTYSPERFTSRLYQDIVSGKPRMAGARAVLDFFEVPEADERVKRYAELKQDRVVELIEAGEFEPFPDALRFVVALTDRGLRIAAASSSKNAPLMLRQIGVDDSDRKLLDLFTADLSGRDFPRGKPDPEIFLASGEALDLAPEHCIVVEDAVAGIEAARAAGMAALGLARADEAEQLRGAGADIVVTTLDDVDLDALAAGRLTTRAGASG